MDETLKSRVSLILGGFALLFFIATVATCSSARQAKNAFDKEMAKRISSEEEVNKARQEKKTVEDNLNNLNQQLQEEQAAHQATKKALVQEQLVNQSLKEELLKVTKLKEALEEDLKEALVPAKSAKKPKK